MPDADPAERLEWNEENFSKVVADLYREAQSDQTLHSRLMTDPYQTLNSRIQVPEEFQGGVFAKSRSKPGITLHVPEYGETIGEALPEGTSETEPKPLYEVTCTSPPPPPW